MKASRKKVYPERSRRVIMAMSGGVDSSVSAALLRGADFDVTGVFMKCWSEDEVKTGVCTAEEDERYARMAAAKIGIPFYSVDLVYEYREKVVEYFTSEYAAGRTPNPDVMCNREIKFGVFYDWAINEFGADYIATGHYARIDRDGADKVFPSRSFSPAQRLAPRLGLFYPSRGSGTMLKQPSNPLEGNTLSAPRLLKGLDPNKDQSYFLWAVDKKKLEKVLFPIGDIKKDKVRELARKFDLPNSERKDSQGICFIGKVDVSNFLNEYIEEKPGTIVNTKGEEVGSHSGLHFYTLGQRKRINIGGGPPYFVVEKRSDTNTLVVAREYDEELFKGDLIASSINWIQGEPKFPFHCTTKIRYRQEDQNAIIKNKDNKGNLFVEFESPQRAVTSGQSIVFYKGDELIGGGVIN